MTPTPTDKALKRAASMLHLKAQEYEARAAEYNSGTTAKLAAELRADARRLDALRSDR